MTLEEIKQLIDLTNESGIAELEVERGGNRVRIRRTLGVPGSQEIVLHPALTQPGGAPPSHATPATRPEPAALVSQQGAAATAASPVVDATLQLIKAPIVGTFYESPKPGSPPFVKVGDTVQTGQVLCIIESMKLMNEIEADLAGVITARLVESGRPVEYGEALFSIRPL